MIDSNKRSSIGGAHWANHIPVEPRFPQVKFRRRSSVLCRLLWPWNGHSHRKRRWYPISAPVRAMRAVQFLCHERAVGIA